MQQRPTQQYEGKIRVSRWPVAHQFAATGNALDPQLSNLVGIAQGGHAAGRSAQRTTDQRAQTAREPRCDAVQGHSRAAAQQRACRGRHQCQRATIQPPQIPLLHVEQL